MTSRRNIRKEIAAIDGISARILEKVSTEVGIAAGRHMIDAGLESYHIHIEVRVSKKGRT